MSKDLVTVTTCRCCDSLCEKIDEMVLIVILSSKREFVTVYLHNFTLLRLFSNAHKRRVLVFLMLLLILFESGVKKEGLNQNSVCFLYREVSHLRHELFELSTLKDASHA